MSNPAPDAHFFADAILLDLDPLDVRRGGLRIERGRVSASGASAAAQPGDAVTDCGGAVLLPGLVNGHTHLYSALAPGMPMPRQAPRNFHEILQRIWWRLDRALDAESIEMSGRVGALAALRCGTTTLIDHHASPNCIDGSLDTLERGIADAGLRAVLCYETTDRNGPGGFEAGLEENRRYLNKCRSHSDGQFGALVGAHAAFTLSDASLRACVELARDFKTGVHVHVAEDPCDDAICRERYGSPLIERLEACGLLPASGAADDSADRVASSSILAHGTHLAPDDARKISARVAGVAHNPRSNMNNSVGYAPVAHMSNVQLGTDGIGSDLFTEARFAWFRARDAQAAPGPLRTTQLSDSTIRIPQSAIENPLTPTRIVEMLAHSARVAGAILGRRLGSLLPGAAADVVVTDYVPSTPLDAANAAAHLIFATGPEHVRDVYVDGRCLLRNHQPLCESVVDRVRSESQRVAAELWCRMEALD